MGIDMSRGRYSEFDREIKRSAELLSLLSDRNRLGIYAILTYGSSRVSDIYRCLSLRQNLISHHLKVLREGGLVKSRRRGREIYYFLDEDELDRMKGIFSKIFRTLELEKFL